MSTKLFVSVRTHTYGFSVDISADKHCGGFCQLFRYVGDAVEFIRDETGIEYATIYTHPFNQGDWQSWSFKTTNQAQHEHKIYCS